MKYSFPYYFTGCLLFFVFISCHTASKVKENTCHFTLLSKNETGIDFNNRLEENDSVNFFYNDYIYTGAGVGVGDFNGDGLQDIFFCGNQVSSKLYINKGSFKFEDVTKSAGVSTDVWCTGVSIVDINNDGLPDIYVCVSGSRDPQKRKNKLFINEGNLHFSEQAAEYGLADTGFSTQAVFFDYDKDGRMDMYLLNHRLYYDRPNGIFPKDTSGNSPAADKLYHNDGIAAGKNHPVFSDVSKTAGIKEDGYGLGITVSDFNNDGWPDIYVANDYVGNDLLWMNNKNGTFTNTIAADMRHQSYNSMGVDAADINNDGTTDVAVLDMMPANNERKKMMFSGLSTSTYEMQRRLGYEPEFARNMLQLNNGTRNIKDRKEPFFSEIGQLAGISETDWSWSVLLADFDNDGWKDMHITNGISRDLTNADYLFFRRSEEENGYSFTAVSNISSKEEEKKKIEAYRKKLDEYGSVKVDNYFFINQKNSTFSDETKASGLAVPSVSHGAAYVDLDNDGALDLVVNNMNDAAFIWRNELRTKLPDSSHFLSILLKGDTQNKEGIGAKISIYANHSFQYMEQYPVRGYASSVDPRLHFGLGSNTMVDSLKIVWPDNTSQLLKKINVNKFITLDYKNAVKNNSPDKEEVNTILFTADTSALPFFLHKETEYTDFNYQKMLPQKYSQLGPPLASGDMNGDGLTDFFVGGAAGQSGKLFFQQRNGSFSPKDLVSGSKPEEDAGAVLFDADGDGDLDLLITGGSQEFGSNSFYNHPRLYNNDGKGNFTFNSEALPKNITDISKAVAVADFDGDGQPDIFIGGRVTPNKYPIFPRSYLLKNEHGVFKDVTKKISPGLQTPGMITDAVWVDINNDKKPDLLICGDYMPVRFFANKNGKLMETTGETGLTNMNGFWRSLQVADIDGDGDMDIIAGNIGINNKYRMSPQTPVKLFAKDVNNNGIENIIPAYYMPAKNGGLNLYPDIDRMQLAEEIPSVKKKYLLFRDYSKITMEELLDNIGMKDETVLSCNQSSSVWIENLGNGKFKSHLLPIEAQYAPVNAIVATDIDKDGSIDLIMAGNEYSNNVYTGRYDASYGLFLKGNGSGSFKAIPPATSRLIIDGDVKSMKILHLANNKDILIAGINNDKLSCFKVTNKKISKTIKYIK